MVSHVGVQGIGEIHRGRPPGQVNHLALRREHINAVVQQFVAELFQHVAALGHVLFPFEDAAQPGDFFIKARIGLAAFLVAPVRSHTQFGMFVHVMRAYLHLERQFARPDHCGVQ